MRTLPKHFALPSLKSQEDNIRFSLVVEISGDLAQNVVRNELVASAFSFARKCVALFLLHVFQMPEGWGFDALQRHVAEAIDIRHVNRLILHRRIVLDIPLPISFKSLLELLLLARRLAIPLVKRSLRCRRDEVRSEKRPLVE